MAIIGILVALLLPAVQAARESQRRSQCANNLKQFGLAFHLHDGSLNRLPDGGEQYWSARSWTDALQTTPAVSPNQFWGWGYQILPYLEEATVWSISDDPTVIQTPVAGFFCPTKRGPSVYPMQASIAAWAASPRAMTDYAGNGGTDTTGTMGAFILGNGKDGAVVRRPTGDPSRSASVSLQSNSFVDGASNTILVSEKCMDVGLYGINQADDDGGYIDGWDWDEIRWGYFPPSPDWYDPDPAMANPDPTSTNVTLRAAFGGSHPGVFMAVFLDGSVRTIRFQVDLTTFGYACSRSDRQPYSPDSL